MGSIAYYVVCVKLRNQTESLPNSAIESPSPLPVLYEHHVILRDGETWETLLNFSLVGVSFHGNSCIVEALTVNGLGLHVNKMASWNSENKGYYLQLFFELWIYDAESRNFTFHNRFVGIWLNVTG
jgi:hypothetical protein